MKKFIVAFTACLASFYYSAQDVTASYELIDSYTVQDVQDMVDGLPGAGLFITPQYDVDVYRVMYNTEYLDGLTEVSGALVIPKGMECKPALFSYQHGTTASKLDVPSYGSAELDICIIFASEGNVLTAPDHIGLGASEVDIHPYVHGFSEAHTTINLLRATREIISEDESIDITLSNQLFLFGYSQGGFSTAAAARYIEEEYPEEFNLTAIAPMSGPYNLAGVQTDFVNSGVAYATPGYLPYIILGHQSVNPTIFDDPSDVFVYPYDTLMPYLFTGHNYSMGYINSQATPIPTDMIHPDVVQQIEDGDHPFYDALEENDLLDWVPETRVNMYYCTADEQVTYENAIVAENVWSAASSNEINAIDLGEYNHSDCVMFALLGGRNFFESLKNNGIDFEVVYNENTNQFEVTFPFGNGEDYSVEWSTGASGTTLGNIDPNLLYTVTVTNDASGCSFSEDVSVNPLSVDENTVFDFNVFPNPAVDQLQIGFPSYGVYQIEIIDQTGKIVVDKKNIHASDILLNISSFERGLYTIQVTHDTNVSMKKVVVN